MKVEIMHTSKSNRAATAEVGSKDTLITKRIQAMKMDFRGNARIFIFIMRILPIMGLNDCKVGC